MLILLRALNIFITNYMLIKTQGMIFYIFINLIFNKYHAQVGTLWIILIVIELVSIS